MKHESLGILTLSCLSFIAGPSTAQQPTPASSQASSPAPAPEPRADVAFAGGTVQQYVAAIGNAFGTANVVCGPGTASVTVAAVNLKQVSLYDAVFMVIPALTQGEVDVQPGDRVWALHHRQIPSDQAKQLRVWPMAKLLSQMKAADALSAVQASLELTGDGAAVKFHEDTTLLIINGTGRQIDAVSQVIDRLENVAGYREGEAERAEAGKHASGLEEQVRMLREEVTALAAQVKAMQDGAGGGTR